MDRWDRDSETETERQTDTETKCNIEIIQRQTHAEIQTGKTERQIHRESLRLEKEIYTRIS